MNINAIAHFKCRSNAMTIIDDGQSTRMWLVDNSILSTDQIQEPSRVTNAVAITCDDGCIRHREYENILQGFQTGINTAATYLSIDPVHDANFIAIKAILSKQKRKIW